MVDYLILCEKPSAAKNFAKALGGKTGMVNGKSYEIVHARGHLLTLKQPEAMVDASKADRYKSWKLADMPWNLADFHWAKEPIISKNPRTGKKESTKSLIDGLRASARGAKAIVIATDVDPSGEGELLAWEVLDAIGWKGTTLRVYFEDEAAPSIRKAFKRLADVSVQAKDGDYLKAESRDRWDFTSMQLTRIATTAARSGGYPVTVVRQGRLKSVIVRHVYEQLEAIKHYVKKPYYEVKFRDEFKHVFARKFTDDEAAAAARFAAKSDGEKDAQKYHESAITGIKKVRKHSAPGALLDLSGLASILATKGYGAKEVLATYQKMYEAQIVSYPRTEDKFISHEQFNEMLPLIDKIAALVGVDSKWLTHRTPRKTHVKDGGAHGANRPGKKVPASLSGLSQYGKSAEAIYTTLAKNFLAMFGEDYVYDAVSARLTDYPEFVTHFSIPVALNYKAIFDTSSQTADENEKDGEDQASSGRLGKTAEPFVYEGANKKPPKPTVKWIMKYLEKHNVGTGATRTSTLADISTGARAQLNEKRGALTTTETGDVTAVMAKDTWIASVDITKQLFDAMAAVGKFKMKPDDILKTATNLVKHDMPIMEKNAAHLVATLGAPKKVFKGGKSFVPKEKTEGTTATGQAVKFNKVWGGHTFTPAEVTDLLAGKTIKISITTKSHKKMDVNGKLEKQTYKGKSFWGFKADFGEDKKKKTYKKTRAK